MMTNTNVGMPFDILFWNIFILQCMFKRNLQAINSRPNNRIQYPPYYT